ncbi:ROK family protein [Kribbella italica]|uniref:Glucokinase n=1 Tax=Kribbella italica TaxID=1540520 RepID=A0A7W9J572_9ACTN|nr:ROK family protein [Kribbella italica]MBB5835733.1 glucokinase [Kribbella italica]
MTARQVVGVDIGGTKIAAATVTAGGEPGPLLVTATPAAAGGEAVLDAVAALVRQASPGTDLDGVGVGTGGVVDHTTGVVLSATDLIRNWAGCEVAAGLGRRLSLPVAGDNDGNTTALGERWYGAGRGLDDVLYVAVGTGIGGALTIGGTLIRGTHHTAGELGHLPVADGTGVICSCGELDHLETVASGPAIAAAYGSSADLREIAAWADTGDGRAAAVIDAGARSLGRGLAGLANVIDPQAVVLNGGVAALGESYRKRVEESMRSHCLPGPAEGVQVRLGQLGQYAAVLGAASLLLDPETATIGAR